MWSKNIQPLCKSVGDTTESVPQVRMATAFDAKKQSKWETDTLKG